MRQLKITLHRVDDQPLYDYVVNHESRGGSMARAVVDLAKEALAMRRVFASHFYENRPESLRSPSEDTDQGLIRDSSDIDEVTLTSDLLEALED